MKESKPSIRIARVFFTTVALLFIGLWSVAFWTTDNPTALERDWRCLWDAGQGFLNGDLDLLYASQFGPSVHEGICQQGYFWLYPPYALYLTALAAMIPLSAVYPLFFLGTYSCFALFILIIRKLYPHTKNNVEVFALAGLASAPLSSVVITGQNSAWLLLAISACLLCLVSKRWLAAAICLSIFGLKPNWLPFFIGWLAYRREWKIIGALAACGGLMLLSTAPLGLDIWYAFQTSSLGYGGYVLEHYPVDKLITAHAAFRSLGITSGAVLTGLWIVAISGGLWSCWVTWRSERSLMAQAGVVLLATISCNIYTNFYDALLLMFPAAVWWFEQEGYSKRLWYFIATIIGYAWWWMWIHFYASKGDGPGHLGLLLLAWTLAEGLQSWRSLQKR